MLCQSNDLVDGGGFKNCTDEASVRIWCPTWVTSHNGPQNFCDHHSKPFRTSETGSFFYGDDADRAYMSVVQFILRSDDRYSGTKGMLMNGGHISGGHGGIMSPGLFVVDGETWLLTYYFAIHLGKYPEVKEMFPKLWNMPKRD